MKRKKLMDEGKERKGRIVTKLFYEKSTLLQDSIFFISVLPFFKSFILTFEQKEPLIHRLPYNKLNLIDVASNVQKLKTYVGDEDEKLVLSLQKNKIRRDIATDFYRKLRTAYVTAAVYIQNKYALSNPLLKFFFA